MEIPDTWDEYYVSGVHVREDNKYRWEGHALNYLEIYLKKENDIQTSLPFTVKDLKPYILQSIVLVCVILKPYTMKIMVL